MLVILRILIEYLSMIMISCEHDGFVGDLSNSIVLISPVSKNIANTRMRIGFQVQLTS